MGKIIDGTQDDSRLCSALEQHNRACYFLDCGRKQSLLGRKMAFYAASIYCAQASREIIEFSAEQRDCKNLVTQCFKVLPRKDLIRLLRRIDFHNFGLPTHRGFWLLGSLSIEGEASFEFGHIAGYKRWPRRGVIRDKSALGISTIDREPIVFDRTLSRQIEIPAAIEQYLEANPNAIQAAVSIINEVDEAALKQPRPATVQKGDSAVARIEIDYVMLIIPDDDPRLPVNKSL